MTAVLEAKPQRSLPPYRSNQTKSNVMETILDSRSGPDASLDMASMSTTNLGAATKDKESTTSTAATLR